MTIKFKNLFADNPWPVMSSFEPIQLSLDGGGREIIVDLIKNYDIKHFLEVGSFLCGSTRKWLGASSHTHIVCADPWREGLKTYLEKLKMTLPSWVSAQVDIFQLDQIINNMNTYGIMEVALNNVSEFRDRVTPVRGSAPEIYEYLKRYDYNPDLIYIDANKEWPEFLGAHEYFPDSIICGDDWTWKNASGNFPVRDYVHRIAEMRNCKVISEKATWIIWPDTKNL